MELKCDAPGCGTIVIKNRIVHLYDKFYSKFHGGTFSSLVFCPEHKERITSGGFDDGDPTTNPDLERSRKKNVEDEIK